MPIKILQKLIRQAKKIERTQRSLLCQGPALAFRGDLQGNGTRQGTASLEGQTDDLWFVTLSYCIVLIRAGFFSLWLKDLLLAKGEAQNLLILHEPERKEKKIILHTQHTQTYILIHIRTLAEYPTTYLINSTSVHAYLHIYLYLYMHECTYVQRNRHIDI